MKGPQRSSIMKKSHANELLNNHRFSKATKAFSTMRYVYDNYHVWINFLNVENFKSHFEKVAVLCLFLKI